MYIQIYYFVGRAKIRRWYFPETLSAFFTLKYFSLRLQQDRLSIILLSLMINFFFSYKVANNFKEVLVSGKSFETHYSLFYTSSDILAYHLHVKYNMHTNLLPEVFS